MRLPGSSSLRDFLCNIGTHHSYVTTFLCVQDSTSQYSLAQEHRLIVVTLSSMERRQRCVRFSALVIASGTTLVGIALLGIGFYMMPIKPAGAVKCDALHGPDVTGPVTLSRPLPSPDTFPSPFVKDQEEEAFSRS